MTFLISESPLSLRKHISAILRCLSLEPNAICTVHHEYMQPLLAAAAQQFRPWIGSIFRRDPAEKVNPSSSLSTDTSGSKGVPAVNMVVVTAWAWVVASEYCSCDDEC